MMELQANPCRLTTLYVFDSARGKLPRYWAPETCRRSYFQRSVLWPDYLLRNYEFLRRLGRQTTMVPFSRASPGLQNVSRVAGGLSVPHVDRKERTIRAKEKVIRSFAVGHLRDKEQLRLIIV